MTWRCALTSPVASMKYLGDYPSLTTETASLGSASALCFISSGLLSRPERLHDSTTTPLRLETAASQLGQSLLAARVRATHTLASITPQVLFHQSLCRNIPRSPRVLVTSIALIISYSSDGALQRAVFLCLQLTLRRNL